jgi:hypothetical protein
MTISVGVKVGLGLGSGVLVAVASRVGKEASTVGVARRGMRMGARYWR